MRKVTQTVVKAWLAGKTKTVDNTRAEGQFLYLHGNAIAQLDGNRVFITTAGWNTSTTRERLKGVLRLCNINAGVFQKGGELYYGWHGDASPWNGEWLCVRA